jgi:hypothetical protein
MKLDELGEIIEPKVGDADLVRMDFEPSCATLHFKLQLPDRLFVLKLHGVIWLSFSTPHTQNVIDTIRITSDTDSVEVPKDIRDLLFRRTLRIPGDASPVEPLTVVRLTPVAGAGPEMVCIARRVEALDENPVWLAAPGRAIPVESYITARLENGGWRVIERRADLTDAPVADFVSRRDAEDWVKWKQSELSSQS